MTLIEFFGAVGGGGLAGLLLGTAIWGLGAGANSLYGWLRRKF